MPTLNQTDLEKVLDEMVNFLDKKGMLPPGANKENVIEKVLTNLSSVGASFDSDDLSLQKNPEKANELRKSFLLALMSESVVSATKDETLKFDYSKLFKKQENENEVKDDLKNEFKHLLKILNNQLSPQTRKTDKELDKAAEILAGDLAKKYMKAQGQESLAENKPTVDIFAEMISAYCSIYGVNPTFAGGFVRPVQAVVGNFVGLIDYNQGGEGSSFMARQNDAEPGKVDYTGAENNTLSNVISGGLLVEELEEALQDTGVLRPGNNWPPRPAPTSQGR